MDKTQYISNNNYELIILRVCSKTKFILFQKIIIQPNSLLTAAKSILFTLAAVAYIENLEIYTL